MQKDYKLSIITINRNNAEGLRKTIESVLSQTWKDYEYIVIDGASTDDSVNVIKNEELKVKNFRWVSESDSGVFQAMNKGIVRAKGEYLLFLNSGDFLVDEHVLCNVFLENRQADILCGRCRVSDGGKIVWVSNPPEKFRLIHFYNATIAHQATFIKKSLFEQYGLYREDFKYMADWAFFLQTIILGNVSTEKIDFIVSDYNLDGISSNEENSQSMQKEKEIIYKDLGLQNIISDYASWEKERNEMKILYWVKSKNILYKPLQLIYKLALRRNKK